jgi:glycosyltransferase involved in cell wall biosynthesis
MPRVAMIVSNRHNPDVRVQKEASALRAAGHEVAIYAFDREHDAGGLAAAIDGVRVERIRVARAPFGDLPRTAIGLARFRAEVKRRLLESPPDVVHCHDQDTCAVGLWWQEEGARQSGKGARGAFVFDAHDLYWTWLLMPDPGSRLRRAGAALLREVDRVYARAADLLITTSEAIGPHPGFAELYREAGALPLVIWNAPDAVPAPPPLPARFTIGYLGTVREPAMFERLLAAIRLLPAGVRPALRIAGAGSRRAEVARLVEAAARELGIPATVTGAYDVAELGALLAETSAQYCVYPAARGNIDRAMAVKLFDSVAHGRRVIGNAGTLMGDWIEAKRWGWTVPDGDVDALARTIAAAREEIGDGRAPSPLEPPPSWRAESEKLVRAYGALLETRR